MSPRLGRIGSSVSATLSQRNLWDSLGRRLGVWGSRDRPWPRQEFASCQLVDDIYCHEPMNGLRRWCREEVQSLSPRMPRFRGQEEEEAPGKGAEGVASGWPGSTLPSLLHQLDGGPRTEEEERACQKGWTGTQSSSPGMARKWGSLALKPSDQASGLLGGPAEGRHPIDI